MKFIMKIPLYRLGIYNFYDIYLYNYNSLFNLTHNFMILFCHMDNKKYNYLTI